TQQSDIFSPGFVDLIAQIDELRVPRFDLSRSFIVIQTTFRRLLQQSLLLLDDAIVICERLSVCGMKRYHAPIEKASASFGPAANYFQFVGRETECVKLRGIKSSRFAFAVDRGFFSARLDDNLQLSFDFVSANDSAGNISFTSAELDCLW